MTTDLAAVLLAEADTAMARRRALLCARVAVMTTSSLAAARQALAEWTDGPTEIRAQALAVLDNLDMIGGTP